MKLKENLILALITSLIVNIILYLVNKNEENPPTYKMYLKNTGLVFVTTFMILMIREKIPSFLGGDNKEGGMIGGSSVDTASPLDNFQQINTGEPTF